MTTEDYLTQLQQDREDLVDNLEAKGITGLTGNETFTELVPEVLNIPSGGSKFAFIGGGSIRFQNDTRNNLQGEVNNIIDNFDTSSITGMSQMFSGCINITSLDLSGFDTSNVTNIASLCFGCTNLETVDMSDWDISNVDNMTQMFNRCSSLQTVDMSSFNSNLATSLINMFTICSSLTDLDMSNFEGNLVTNADYMFSGDTSLMKIDMRKFGFSNLTSYTNMFGPNASSGPPNNCLIIVKDATQKQWINTNFPRLTNVKTVAEYEAE